MVVVFTFELECLPAWQRDFLVEGLALEELRFPAIEEVADALGGRTPVERIPTPGERIDGFFEAFWRRRPEALLDPAIRSARSTWALLEPGVEERIVTRLAAALESSAWDGARGHLRAEDTFADALRLVIFE